VMYAHRRETARSIRHRSGGWRRERRPSQPHAKLPMAGLEAGGKKEQSARGPKAKGRRFPAVASQCVAASLGGETGKDRIGLTSY